MKVPPWYRIADCSTEDLLVAMSNQGVDSRRLKAVERFINDPREFPSDRIPFLVYSGLPPNPITLCDECSDPLELAERHSCVIEGEPRTVHVDCCTGECSNQ